MRFCGFLFDATGWTAKKVKVNVKYRPVFIIIKLVLSFSACSTSTVRADPYAIPLFGTDVQVRVEMSENNGVYSCRPYPEDLELFSFIVKNNLDSLGKYTEYLKNNISYKSSVPGQAWPAWQDTLKNRSADCKGLSVFNRSVLRLLGYPSEILIIRGRFVSHAVCVFMKGKRYYIFDNYDVIATDADTLEKLGKDILYRYEADVVARIGEDLKRPEKIARKSG